MSVAWLLMPDYVDLENRPGFSKIVRLSVIAFFVPVLGEEVIFRGLFNLAQTKTSIAISTVAFVLWHPLGAWLFVPEAFPQFTDHRFLLFVGIFGVFLCLLRKWGLSMWPPIVCHWILVVSWKAAGGAQF